MAAENGEAERWAARSMPATGPVLEIGCGPGVGLEALGSRGIGVDVSRPMVVEARSRAPTAVVVQADAAALPFSNGAFSAAMAVHCLALLPAAALAELRRVLVAGAPMVGVHRTVEEGGPELHRIAASLRDASFREVCARREAGRMVVRARA